MTAMLLTILTTVFCCLFNCSPAIRLTQRELMPATFPLDFMDLAMFISPIRPGIGDLEPQKEDARNMRGSMF